MNRSGGNKFFLAGVAGPDLIYTETLPDVDSNTCISISSAYKPEAIYYPLVIKYFVSLFD